MRRRLGFVVAIGLLAGVTACAPGVEDPGVPADVLVVTMDTARADRFSYAGASPVTTVATDAVAAEGAAFLTAVAPSPITLVSHSSLFTGQDPFVHGVRNNGDFALAPEALTLAEVFSAAGWTTAAFVGASVLDRRYGLDQGFVAYDDTMTGIDATGMAAYARRPGDEVVSAALEWLSAAPTGPTFVWVHLYDPHAPYEPPEPEKSRYSNAPYDGTIAFTDRMVGRLLEGYRRVGRYDRALVVLTADHGESLGEHQERAHGVFVYDATVRIPLVMRGPGIAPGTRIASQAALIDVMPTVLGLAGFEIPPSLDGRDLSGVVRGGPVIEGDRSIYVESLLPELSFGWSPLRGLRSDRWKFIQGAAVELYDLEADPGELDDVAAENTDVAMEMSRQMVGLVEHEGSTTATTLEVDEAERSRLAALGYITLVDRDGDSREAGDLLDPRERIESLNRMYSAMTRFAEGDEEGAINELDQLLADEPANHSVVATSGSLRFRTGDFAGAADAYSRAARLAPEHAHYSELEAVSLERLGRFEEALDACVRALAAEPDRTTSRDIRWRLLGRMGRNDVLIQETRRVVEEDPGDGMARVLLEQARIGPGPSEALVRALDGALADLPGNLPLTAALADAVAGMGDADRADQLYRQVLQERPDNLNAALVVGSRALAEGKTDEASRFIDAGVRHHPDSAAMQVLVARLRASTGDYVSAREALVRAYRLAPGWAETWLAAGELGMLEGLPEQSAANLDRAAAAAGDDPELWRRLAEANRKLGRPSEAAAADARSQRR
ncbi:MAG: sulfatase-like hydrolase/transferase [Acidobacteriota bacterium]|nr:sulfatase-like hydrolase/transferase [Acidobacteriota bacterium]